VRGHLTLEAMQTVAPACDVAMKMINEMMPLSIDDKCRLMRKWNVIAAFVNLNPSIIEAITLFSFAAYARSAWEMINTDTAPPTDPIVSQSIADVIEKLADSSGSEKLAAQLQAAIAETTELVGRVITALQSIDLVRELTASKSALESLQAEAQKGSEVTARARADLTRRIELLRKVSAWRHALQRRPNCFKRKGKPDMIIQHSNATHEKTCVSAEAVRQQAISAAYVAGGGSSVIAAAIKTAEISFYRTVVASCLSNGLPSAQFGAALRDLGTA
jgi:hypothetical protein